MVKLSVCHLQVDSGQLLVEQITRGIIAVLSSCLIAAEYVMSRQFLSLWILFSVLSVPSFL